MFIAKRFRLSSFKAISASALKTLTIAVVMAATALTTPALSAQSSSAPRVHGPVLDEQRLTLKGNVPMKARTQTDLGEANASTQMTNVRLILARSPQQEAALDQYLVELQDKTSENFHKWLTPEQFGKLYGPADSDIAAIQAWLESHGLKVQPVPAGRTTMIFSGTVSQVEEALKTKIHSFDGNKDHFLSNVSDPSIPSALSSVVKGVAQLNTIRPKSSYEKSRMGTYNPSTKRLTPVERVNAIRPNLTSGSGTNSDPYFLYMVPGDAGTIYDVPNKTFNPNYTSGNTYTGSGVTIGIGGDSLIQAQTVADFRTAFLGNSTPPTIVNATGVEAATENGDADEAYIDTELSGGMAPGAALIYYPSDDLVTGIENMLTANKVSIFSLSFGECELDLTTSGNAQFNGYWQQAAALGITVTVSTGDSDSSGCDANSTNTGANVTEAVQGLQVNGLASTPYNIAVGGTDTDGLLSNFTNYVDVTSATSDSATLFRSALNYIPESTWNNSTSADGSISGNTPLTGTDSNGNPYANIVGGGGGKSSCSTTNGAGTACTSGYVKPYWQRGTGVPNDSARDIPDVSLMAGNGFDSATWLVCTDDSGQNGSGVTVTSDCATQSDGFFYFQGFGGTSTAAPAFAGILALVEQKAGSGRLGQATKELYDLYNGPNAAAIFHDTTIGNNASPCTSGTPNCTKDSAGYYYESGYNTTTGYDLATGLGSVDVAKLVNFWGSATGALTVTVKGVATPTSIVTNQSVSIAVTVTGTSTGGAPTGSVKISGADYTGSSVALTGTSNNAAIATISIPANSLTAGTDALTITYAGDTTYASATGTVTITATAPPLPVVGLNPTSLTFASSPVGTADPTQTVTLTNSGNAALTVSSVSVTGTNSSSFTETNNCGSVAISGTCAIVVTFNPASAGSLTASLSIADNAINSPQTVSLSGTGTAVAPSGTISLSATAVSVTAGSTGTSTVTATGAGGYAGTVNFTCSIAALSGGSDAPTCAAGTAATISTVNGMATGTVTVSTTAANSSARRRAALDNHTNLGRILGTGAVAFAGLLFFGIPARNRKWKALLSMLILAAGFGALAGCGGSSTSKNPGTTAGTYTVTVTGTDSTTSSITPATTTFTLTVQ